MGDPVSIGLAFAGMMSSTIGAIREGQAASKAANVNAQVATNNAAAARLAAIADADTEYRLGRKRLGAVRLRGLSSLDLLAEAAGDAKWAELTILHGGEVEAAGYEQTAGLDRLRGRTARSEARFSAATSLLSGVPRIYDIAKA
jgi:hypothetical protein